jgi:hypothetical protein
MWEFDGKGCRSADCAPFAARMLSARGWQMLVGTNVVVRTAREADLDGLYDLIADVRTIGDH